MSRHRGSPGPWNSDYPPRPLWKVDGKQETIRELTRALRRQRNLNQQLRQENQRLRAALENRVLLRKKSARSPSGEEGPALNHEDDRIAPGLRARGAAKATQGRTDSGSAPSTAELDGGRSLGQEEGTDKDVTP